MKSIELAAWLLITALFVVLLIIAKQLLIPLAVAVSIWFLINTIADYFKKVEVLGIKIPRWLSFMAAAVTMIGIFAFSINIIMANVEKMVEATPAYERTFNLLISELLSWMDLEETPSLAKLLEQIDIRRIIVNLGASISNIAGKLVLIIIYVIFLLLEQQSFEKKYEAFFSNPVQYQRGMQILERINDSVKTYLTVKTFASFLTGGLSYLGLKLIGVDFAAFWAFLIFLLNFIPSIGSIIATGLVGLFALLQFQAFPQFFITLIVIGGIQLAIGNYLDPRMMGKSLNISPLVVLLSLALWGSIWGVIGMVLSVPLMVILMIILSQFQQTMPLAVLLSQNGRILEWEEHLEKRKRKKREKEIEEVAD
jgi:AI-2 transport protein TqsA